MEPICRLRGSWNRFAGGGSVVSEPGLGSPIQFLEGLTSVLDVLSRLQIQQDCPELAPTSEREIIDAKLWNFPNWLCRQRQDPPQNGVTRRLYPPSDL
jgi:hypothetical protein